MTTWTIYRVRSSADAPRRVAVPVASPDEAELLARRGWHVTATTRRLDLDQ